MELGHLCGQVGDLRAGEHSRQRVKSGHVVVEHRPDVLVVPSEDATVAAPDLGEHAVEPRRAEQACAAIELLVVLDEEEVRTV